MRRATQGLSMSEGILCILGTNDGARVPFCGELYIHELPTGDGFTYNATRYFLRSYGHEGEVRKFYVEDCGGRAFFGADAGARIRETWGD